jgi:hypothetical protein
VGEFLADEKWLAESAGKLSRNNSLPQEDNRRRLVSMLEDIRDTLRAVDPLLEDIDRRNMQYARSSVERVKALLEPDSTLAGKLSALIKEIYRGDGASPDRNGGPELHRKLAHRLHRIRTFAPESLYRRYQREAADFRKEVPQADREAMDMAEAELLIRLRRQLGVKRVGDWLDAQGGRERVLGALDLVKDQSSFIHFIYSVLYADSRPAFGYGIEDPVRDGAEEGKNPGPAGEAAFSADKGSVRTGGYVVPDVLLRRKG